MERPGGKCDLGTVGLDDGSNAKEHILFYRMKLVVEPSGALGVAALLRGAVQPNGRVGIVISGGNIDAATTARILKETD